MSQAPEGGPRATSGLKDVGLLPDMKAHGADQCGPVKSASDSDVCRFRNSPMQNVCVDLLRDGYHRSFRELFFLIGRWHEKGAVPGSAQRPLEDQEWIHSLVLLLRQSEEHHRTGSWTEVCDRQLSLSQLFRLPGDDWLQLHFLQRRLEAAERGAPHTLVVQALCELGAACLQQGLLDEARRHGNRLIQETERQTGLSEEDLSTVRLHVCQTLWNICKHLGDTNLLALVLQRAADSGDRLTEADVSYHLGLTNHSAGAHEEAKKYLRRHLVICEALKDPLRLGPAYKAMAQCMESGGGATEAVDYLQRYVEVSRSNQRKQDLQDAHTCLGSVYYSKGEYERASECFQTGYDIACELGAFPLIQRAQSLVGSAHAQSLIRKLSVDLVTMTRANQTPASSPLTD